MTDGLKRLEQNKELFYTHKENVEIAIHGYDLNYRELFEIKEIREWVKNILDNIEGLAFFLVNAEFAQFLKLILFCSVEIRTVEGSEHYLNGILRRKCDYNIADAAEILKKLFLNLNNFSKKNNIPINIVEEISDNITDCYSGGEFKKYKNKA